jgi:hypothetical protein
LIAEITKFYGWGPRDAWCLTLKELDWWNEQAGRIAKKMSN